MEKLVRPNGPARFIGVSNFSPKQMEEILAAATIKPKVHQFELHPYLQQRDFVDWHHKNNITVIGYAPLGNTSPYYAQPSKDNPTHPPIMTQNPILLEIAKNRGCASAAQVALAFNNKRNVAVIPKAAKAEHQAENVQVEKCKLTDDDFKKIVDMSKQYSGRFNNPCKTMMKMPCYEGLDHPDQGR
jgi:alcohol dehydrogenase (NADP+)